MHKVPPNVAKRFGFQAAGGRSGAPKVSETAQARPDLGLPMAQNRRLARNLSCQAAWALLASKDFGVTSSRLWTIFRQFRSSLPHAADFPTPPTPYRADATLLGMGNMDLRAVHGGGKPVT